MKLTKTQLALITITIIALFLLIYSPHLKNPFPLHIDEWHHITESIKLEKGEYSKGDIAGIKIGFHIILLLINKITNLITIYKFLPAIWAVLTAITILATTYKLTNNFTIAFFSLIFFSSLKSNVNILGLWFFVPLTFSIPFIYLYIYFFTRGLKIQNKNYILLALTIMIILIPIHAVSVLFAIPILILSALPHLNYIKKEYKFFSLFLIIPIASIFFFSSIRALSLFNTTTELTNLLQFKKGYNPLELDNSFLETYSLTGYILAIIGTFYLIKKRKSKQYLPYLIWPIYLLFSIAIFRITEISFLSPYQRNFYYFALSIPFLSSIGTNYIINLIRSKLKKQNIKNLITISIFILIIFLSFKSYYKIPQQLQVYTIITPTDYEDLLFLTNFPSSKVLANPFISTALYPTSNHKPIATIYFYNSRDRTEVEAFFQIQDCKIKNLIIEKHKPKYIISKIPINCDYKLLSKKNNYIYEIQ